MNKCKKGRMLPNNRPCVRPCVRVCVCACVGAHNPLTGLQAALSFVHLFFSTHISWYRGCQSPHLGLEYNGLSKHLVKAKPLGFVISGNLLQGTALLSELRSELFLVVGKLIKIDCRIWSFLDCKICYKIQLLILKRHQN